MTEYQAELIPKIVQLPYDEYSKLINAAKNNADQAAFYLGNKRPESDIDIFSKEQVDKILNTTTNSLSYRSDAWGAFQRTRDLVLIKTCYTLALRPSEVRQLMMSDFKIRENGLELDVRPETNKERIARTIQVPEKLYALIKKYLDSFPREYFWRGSPYLFPSMHGSPMCSSTWRHKWNKLLGEAGLYIKGEGLYILRHSRATHLLDIGYSIFDVQKLLGHTTTECTMTYVHKTIRSRDRERKMLSEGI